MTVPCENRMAKLPSSGWNLTANQTIFQRPGNGQRGTKMFVRAVWRDRRLVENRRDMHQLEVPTRPSAAILGLSTSDLSQMTRGLFDRPHREGAGPVVR
jgi:hypothetical protein